MQIGVKGWYRVVEIEVGMGRKMGCRKWLRVWKGVEL
jgi:hypothetical protein